MSLYKGLLIFLLVGVSVFCQGQSYNSKEDSFDHITYQPNVIKTSPLALIWSQIPLTGELRFYFERRLTESTASMVGVSYIFKSPIFAWAENLANQNNPNAQKLKFNGLRLQGMQKFYVFEEYFKYHQVKPEGLYIGPHFSINHVRITNPQFPGSFISLNFLNLNFVTGLQIFLGPLALDGYVGLGIRHNFIETRQRPGQPVVTRNINQFMPEIVHPNLKISLSTNLGFAY